MWKSPKDIIFHLRFNTLLKARFMVHMPVTLRNFSGIITLSFIKPY